MIIGFVRHFKVDLPGNKSVYSTAEFNKQMIDYDSAPVIANNLDINESDWDICYCSDLLRAITTAHAIYKKEIIKTGLLREVPLRAFTNTTWRLPSFIWHFAGRIAWRFNKQSQPEVYEQTLKRVHDFYDLISSQKEKKVLVVTHGFFMRVLYEELIKKGFRGEIELNPRNGKLYIMQSK